MVLYIDPENVDWMNDAILERILVALRDRIPTKLSKEGFNAKEKGGKDKEKVDVFRGADYQMCFFFRKTRSRHAVLLKDKTLIMPSSPPKRRPRSDDSPGAKKRRRRDQTFEADDLGQLEEELNLTGEQVGEDEDERPVAGGSGGGGEILPKEEEEDGVIPIATTRKRRAEDDLDPEPEAEEEEEIDLDIKPQLKVKYTGYAIFSRSLIVIVEPYPRLPNSHTTSNPRLLSLTADRSELTATPAPVDLARRSVTGTPAPKDKGKGKEMEKTPLFRRETTPPEEEDEEQLGKRMMRESSHVLGGDWVEED